MKTIKIGLFLLLITCTTAASYSQSNKFKKDIKKLLHITGSAKIGIQVATQIMASFKQIYLDVPNEFWDEFLKEIKEDELIDLIVPIYVRYYTHDEIKGLINFYKTPLGKKTIEVLPNITQDSMLAGQEWGKQLGEQIAIKLKNKGY